MPGISGRRSNAESFSLAVLGEAGVGKSAIIIRFCENMFDPEYQQALFSSVTSQYMIDNVPALVKIYDSSEGAEHFCKEECTIAKCDGFLLVFSVTNRSSFAEIQELHRHIRVINNHNQFPMIMIGNKADMDSDRTVSFMEAQKLDSELGIPYIECSAASGMNVEYAFHELVRIVRKFRMSKEQRRTTEKY